MVILLEPTQNAAMKQADPYSSTETIWYHVIWGTQGTRIPAAERRILPGARRVAANGRIGSSKPITARTGVTFCDASLRDQPIQHHVPTTESVAIPRQIRPTLACAICDVCARRRLAIRCMSIGVNHVHALMKLDADADLVRATVEDCKRISCLLACSDGSEGLWAKGCELLPVRSELHFDRVSQWICHDHQHGSHVWKHPRLMRAEEESRAQGTEM